MEIDRIVEGDCLEELPKIDDNSIDAIVTDPPAAINFMQKSWDSDKGGRTQWIAWMSQVAAECIRVIKPGGHALVWALPRTSHWTGMAWEEAGWEPRDKISHVFGSGFPKSLDISKKIDQMFPRMEMFDEFAKHFSECRKTKGLSQKEIAVNFPSKTGGLTGCVWNWENGANVPTLAQWEILQPILGLSDDFRPLIERIEAEREVIGKAAWNNSVHHFVPGENHRDRVQLDITAPATSAAKQWAGWGSAIKPSHEDWWLFRKPLACKTIAENVLEWGCGGLNIDSCRISTNEVKTDAPYLYKGNNGNSMGAASERLRTNGGGTSSQLGRFPANLIWSHSPLCKRIGTKKVKGDGHYPKHKKTIGDGNIYGKAKPFDAEERFLNEEEVENWDCHPSCPSWEFAKAGESKARPAKAVLKGERSGKIKADYNGIYGRGLGDGGAKCGYLDTDASVARFFKSCQFTEEDIPAFVYVAKASRGEREKGLIASGIEKNPIAGCYGEFEGDGRGRQTEHQPAKNNHPTVKPIALMRYLCRMITPPNGLILDPFAGSGTTLLAAKQEGFRFIGIEKDAEYHKIACKRIAAIPRKLTDF